MMLGGNRQALDLPLLRVLTSPEAVFTKIIGKKMQFSTKEATSI